ncbi:MAG: FtsW/RodA/SpoVE family cell cycle protein [Candidatus Krumholzibacteria bacterium]
MAMITVPQLKCDKRILLIVVFLMVIGASLVGSAGSHFSGLRFDDVYFLLKRHLVRIVIAAFFLLLACHIDYRILRKPAPFAFGVGVAMLVALLIFGHKVRDTERWLTILQVTFQPVEVARLALVMFVAYWVARKGTALEDFKRGFLPVALAVVVVLGLIAAQPNYGSAFATAAIAFLMLYLGGARIRHLLLLALAMGSAAAVRLMGVGYVRDRFLAFLNQNEGLSDINWQIRQSLIALGSGGIVGVGIGGSRQKLGWLPDAHTDFIFSILGEEMGLLGTLAVSLAFLLLALRALKISFNSGDRFGHMLAVGIGCSIFVYALMNMLVATGLFPVTGLPLPFLSYGGSALVVNAFSVGILLNVSKKRPGQRPARNGHSPA